MMSRRLFGDFWLGAATRKYRSSETLICWMSAMKKTPICIFRWLMKWRNGTRKAGSLFSLSSNLTSEERPERPINEQALVAACAPGLPHSTPTSPGPHSMRAGSAMSLRRGSPPTS